ncbi:MAG TPA: translation elongation factor Ts [bacterium]
MIPISAEDVKKLREATGAGMMACKEALVASNGDFEKAIEYLRKKGIASAEKRSGREVKEGLVVQYMAPDHSMGVMVEINCETDFVAKTADFQTLAGMVAQEVAARHPAKEDLGEDPNLFLRERIMEVSGKLGEAISIRKAVRFKMENAPGTIVPYIHPGSRLGVMVEVQCSSESAAATDTFKTLAKDTAMQVAATNPVAVRREEVPKDTVERELDIYRTQVQDQKKPPAILEKIVQGKLDKYFQEAVLLEQGYVKDPGKTMQEHIQDISKQIGADITVKRFVRFQLGEA